MQGDELIDAIGAQKRRVDSLAREKRAATRRLAELVAATQDDPNPRVSYSAAGRAMGTHRSYASDLVARLRRGEFDGA